MTTPHRQDDGLLPCPFCGEKRISLNEPSEDYRYGSINCPGCLAVMPGEVRDRNELISCWNARITPASWTRPDAMRAAIIKECEQAARGPVYKEIYNGSENENWSSDSDYGRGRHSAADAVATLSPAPVPPADGVGERLSVPFNPCLAKLREGEPFFVLLGRDKQAPNAVMTWANDRQAAEGKSAWTEEAREVAYKMAAYSEATALAPLPAGAAEADLRMLEYERRLNDIATTCQMDGREGDANDLWRIAKQIAASPPVRGEREAIARAICKTDGYDYDAEQELATKFEKLSAREIINRAHRYADTILSLQSSPAALSPTEGASTAEK